MKLTPETQFFLAFCIGLAIIFVALSFGIWLIGPENF